jgi:lipopolysaccharide export system permease protein
LNFNIKIIDRYIFSQVLKATAFWLIVFIVVWISPEILLKIIRKFVNGEIPFQMAIRLLLLEMPEILTKAVPVGLMLGSIIVFDRLSRDSELTIIRMIGVSLYRLILPILALSVCGVFICYFIYKDLIPYSSSNIKALKNDFFQSNFVYIDKDKNKMPKQILVVG